jgi:hypothetical protein
MWDRKVEGGFPELKILVGVVSPQSFMTLMTSSRNSGFATKYSLVHRWDIQTSFEFTSSFVYIYYYVLVSGF